MDHRMIRSNPLPKVGKAKTERAVKEKEPELSVALSMTGFPSEPPSEKSLLHVIPTKRLINR